MGQHCEMVSEPMQRPTKMTITDASKQEDHLPHSQDVYRHDQGRQLGIHYPKLIAYSVYTRNSNGTPAGRDETRQSDSQRDTPFLRRLPIPGIIGRCFEIG
jgi:hypothetical protein